MNKKSTITTTIYINDGNKYLFLYRNKEENDFNKGFYLGVGGHKEDGETIDQCIVRETKEETNLDLLEYKYRGVIEFEFDKFYETMHLYTSDKFKGEIKDCDEGTLVWIDKEDILKLNLYEGDKYFINDLLNNLDNIHYKFIYNGYKLKEVIKL